LLSGLIHSWKFVHRLGFSSVPVSVSVTRFESMFEVSLPDGDALHGADDAAVVAAIVEWARAEASAGARRLAAIAELVARRADGPADCGRWSCDNWDAVAAEVAAAQGISHATASGQMYLAVALCDRVPKVAALFAEGTISARLASAIVWHTDLIKDPETLRLVDETLAEDAKHFGPLSAGKTAKPSTPSSTATTPRPYAAAGPARVGARW
jgi:hypothetical protein